MGKSYTRNGLAHNLASAKFQTVSDWTKKEWDKLSHDSSFPICLKLANGDYRVATFKAQRTDKAWHVLNAWNEELAEVTSEAAAVVYCVLQHKGKYIEAQQLVDIDTKVTRLQQDRVLFSRRLSSAYEKKDGWQIDLYTSRYKNTLAQLYSAQVELNKMLRETKYIKSYRNDYET